MAHGSAWDSNKRMWNERAPTWRRMPMPITSDSSLQKRKPLKSELPPIPPKEKS